MKKIRLLPGVLTLSLAVLMSIAFGAENAKAALWCYQISGCTGQAGCLYYGGVIGPCKLECSDLTQVQCNFPPPDPEPCYPIRLCKDYEEPIQVQVQ